MGKIITNSISFFDEAGYVQIADVISQDGFEDNYGISDISVFEEYHNLIFDCSETNAEKMMKTFMSEYPNAHWRWMKNDGEIILSISSYDSEGFSCDPINKTMEEIAADSKYGCGGSCADCTHDCAGGCHGEGCTCGECASEAFSMEKTIEMINETVSSLEGEEYFSVLTAAYHEEVELYVKSQFPDEDEAEEAQDIFLNTMAFIAISAASCDGVYGQVEHKYVSYLVNGTSPEKIREIIDNDTLMSEEGINERLKVLGLWRDAEKLQSCDVRRLFLTICVYLCACDGRVNEKEYAFLRRIEAA